MFRVNRFPRLILLGVVWYSQWGWSQVPLPPPPFPPPQPEEQGSPSDLLVKSAGLVSEKYLIPIPKDFLLQSALLRIKGALVNPEMAQQSGFMFAWDGRMMWDMRPPDRQRPDAMPFDPAKAQQLIKKLDEVYAAIRQKPEAPDSELTALLEGLFALNRSLGVAPDSALVRMGLNGMLNEVNGRLDQGDSRGRRWRRQGDQIARIGISFRILEDGYPRVAFVYPNSPAQQADVRPGDTILKIDGKDTKGKMMEELSQMIRGKSGTKVTLTLQREGLEKPKEVEVVRSAGMSWGYRWARSKFVAPDSKIAYIRFSPFQTIQEGREEDLDEMVQELAGQGMAGLILDLRWGNMESFQTAAAMIDRLVGGEWTLVYESRSGVQTEKRAAKAGEAYPDVPVVVLVDRPTFGPLELMAAAVKATGRGLVIGDTTQGRAVGQQEFPVPGHDYRLRFAAAIYRTPKGEPYQGRGIEPDIRVAMDPEVRNRLIMRMQREDYGQQMTSYRGDPDRRREEDEARDIQLEKAIEYLGGTAFEPGKKLEGKEPAKEEGERRRGGKKDGD